MLLKEITMYALIGRHWNFIANIMLVYMLLLNHAKIIIYYRKKDC